MGATVSAKEWQFIVIDLLIVCRWFDMYADPDTKTSYYKFNGKYWDSKLKGEWSQCPEIYWTLATIIHITSFPISVHFPITFILFYVYVSKLIILYLSYNWKQPTLLEFALCPFPVLRVPKTKLAIVSALIWKHILSNNFKVAVTYPSVIVF